MDEGALEVKRLSPRELCEWNLEGRVLLGDHGVCVKEGSGDGQLSP